MSDDIIECILFSYELMEINFVDTNIYTQGRIQRGALGAEAPPPSYLGFTLLDQYAEYYNEILS